MKKILFVHGFGVQKDARGMFTDIVRSLDDSEFHTLQFDLNNLDDEGNMVVNAFSKQVHRLRDVWENESKDSEVYIIAHSQGCLITAMANLPNIKKTIFLAPPTDNNSEEILKYFRSKKDTVIDLEGVSRLARSDGSCTVVPATYWVEKDAVHVQELYQNYVIDHSSVVVRATQDEVISNDGIATTFEGIEVRDIATNHNFEGEGRGALIDLVKELLH